MTTFLPKDVQAGLDAARKRAQKKSHRLRVQVGEDWYPVLRAWEGGFALDAEDAPHLRGLVDLYDGARHLSQCLIVASEEEAGEIRFEYKRMTEATGEQPVDFERAPDAPIALLGKD
ncbi:hypothetical protein [Roseovarius salinarum]|uniref:hypothetical protein n=1 Tax=Roseovarius salinarum TaxID=1981892 RepID=UPI000C343B91|nr:hypothetical protein [Roseovarius salinarum]